MGKMTEKKILDKYHIADMSQLTKKAFIELMNSKDEIDPEVFEKIVKVFPEYTSAIKEMLSDLKEIVLRGMDSNDATLRNRHETNMRIIGIIEKELDKDCYNPEQRVELTNMLEGVSKSEEEMDKENKNFLADNRNTIVGGVIAAGFIMTLVLQGKKIISK